jgi:hypothetical protein
LITIAASVAEKLELETRVSALIIVILGKLDRCHHFPPRSIEGDCISTQFFCLQTNAKLLNREFTRRIRRR